MVLPFQVLTGPFGFYGSHWMGGSIFRVRMWDLFRDMVWSNISLKNTLGLRSENTVRGKSMGLRSNATFKSSVAL